MVGKVGEQHGELVEAVAEEEQAVLKWKGEGRADRVKVGRWVGNRPVITACVVGRGAHYSGPSSLVPMMLKGVGNM